VTLLIRGRTPGGGGTVEILQILGGGGGRNAQIPLAAYGPTMEARRNHKEQIPRARGRGLTERRMPGGISQSLEARPTCRPTFPKKDVHIRKTVLDPLTESGVGEADGQRILSLFLGNKRRGRSIYMAGMMRVYTRR